MFQQTPLHIIDWIIIISYLIISIGLGLTLSTKIKSMTDFVTAGQSVKLWLGVASMAGVPKWGSLPLCIVPKKGLQGLCRVSYCTGGRYCNLFYWTHRFYCRAITQIKHFNHPRILRKTLWQRCARWVALC